MQLDERDDDTSHLTECAVEEAALTAVLEHIPWAAVICDEDGAVVRANAAAERWQAADRAGWQERIARAIRGEVNGLTTAVSRLAVPGHATHFLVVAKSGGDRVKVAVEAARHAWELTARESQVLAALAAGHSNRDVAAKLELAARTIELHVTSLLRKAGVGSRAQLIIALWELSETPRRH